MYKFLSGQSYFYYHEVLLPFIKIKILLNWLKPLSKFGDSVQKIFRTLNFLSRPNFNSFHLVHDQILSLSTKIAITHPR